MDRKYLKSSVALPEEAHTKLNQAMEVIQQRIGFKPSRSDAVAYLANYFLEREAKENERV